MDDQLEMFPSGLSRAQVERLTAYADDANEMSADDLRSEVEQHLDMTRSAYQRSRIVNLRLATAIAETIAGVLEQWSSLPANGRNWLAGAFLYYAKCDDDEPDFDSPIGFEDDTEVLNACLRFVGLHALCISVEDFDDV